MENNIFNQDIITKIVKAIIPKFVSKDEANNFMQGRRLTVLSESGTPTKGSGIYPPGTMVYVHTGDDVYGGYYGIEWFECTSSGGSTNISSCDALGMKLVGQHDTDTPSWYFGHYKFIMPDCDLTIKGRVKALFSISAGGGIYATNFLKYGNFGSIATDIMIPAVDPVNGNTGDIIQFAGLADCYKLKHVTLDSRITMIGSQAFSGCSELESIRLSDNTTKIEGYAFRNCLSLKNINLPESIEIIHSDAFSECKSLTEINLPSKLDYINSNCFENCTSLYKVTIGKNVTVIDSNAFDGCDCLKYVDIDGNNTVLRAIGNFAFRNCNSLLRISFPSEVNEIGLQTFYFCLGLKEIVIHAPQNSIANAPWGAPDDTKITWY